AACDRVEQPREQAWVERGLDLVEQLDHARPAIDTLGREPALERLAKPSRDRARAWSRWRSQLTGLDRPGDLPGGAPLEGPLAQQRLPQRHAEAELIGARIGAATEVLLERHVRRRARKADGRQQLGPFSQGIAQARRLVL